MKPRLVLPNADNKWDFGEGRKFSPSSTSRVAVGLLLHLRTTHPREGTLHNKKGEGGTCALSLALASLSNNLDAAEGGKERGEDQTW